MYSNNNMPYYVRNIPNRNSFGLRRNNDRFFGGFAVPFLLGGITGGLLARPNNYGSFQPYPVPYPYIVNPGFSTYSSYPSYTENYYYY